MSPENSTSRFSEWLVSQVVDDARGTHVDELDIAPAGRFWLGTLVSEEFQVRMDRGERGERLDPSAIGVRFQPSGDPPWEFDVEISFAVWIASGERWVKAAPGRVAAQVRTSGSDALLAEELSLELHRLTGRHELSAELRIDLVPGLDRHSLEVTVVNTSPEWVDGLDTHLYEVELALRAPGLEPFILESLPDSFRYDRRVPAYGINVGVVATADGWIRTADTLQAFQQRPRFWNAEGTCPDLSFTALAEEPLTHLRALVDAHGAWGAERWADRHLSEMARDQHWTDEMWDAARSARANFEAEHERLRDGLASLSADATLLRAFRLMNEAFLHSSRGKYEGWRPFQIGFILATCRAVAEPTSQADTADIVWFATGGGKTETYLGLVTMAALHDRLTGKTCGVAAWSRFPLRLLSLQQTQRFADAVAGAELVRRDHALGGEPFGLGFLIGASSTPNRILEDPQEEGQPDPEDPAMPSRYRVLLECPFCFDDRLEMGFDYERWTLDHRCSNPHCPWGGGPLPVHVVDDEIYRFLPTVVVGTLDKIASLSIQASMAGLFGPPRGFCSQEGHGHTYAPRSTRKFGCLVPSCERRVDPLPMPADRYAPTFRLQDELHLLRDALGAVDAHYEALIDHLQLEMTGTAAKIVGSSATLSGFERQVDVLYRRRGRVFPVQGPSATDGFWTAASEELARRHIALAPRGATLEFANDRIVTVLQESIRRLLTEPERVCSEAGVPIGDVPLLLSQYGTTVVYGNTIRDLDAAARSLETQVPVEGRLNTADLTGQTPFDEVRATLDRLVDPEPEFDDRIHVVTASSMMSHGVDVDRLNVMVVLGLPLTAAEYIQTTARVGRRWPGIVFVLHKMVRERDTSTFRAWHQFVSQGDRFVEPVPITRRSVRVLEKTLPGLFLGRLLHIHERKARKALTTVKNLRGWGPRDGFDRVSESSALVDLLAANDDLDGAIRAEIERWVEHYFDALDEPPPDARFPSDLCPGGQRPMLSLRDVEKLVPVQDIRPGKDR